MNHSYSILTILVMLLLTGCGTKKEQEREKEKSQESEEKELIPKSEQDSKRLKELRKRAQTPGAKEFKYYEYREQLQRELYHLDQLQQEEKQRRLQQEQQRREQLRREQYALRIQIQNLVVSSIDENSSRFKPVKAYDSRLEIYSLKAEDTLEARIISNSKGIFGVIDSDLLFDFSEDSFRLVDVQTLGTRFSLCDDEPYHDQPSPFLGTAFLVSKSHVLTARHVLSDLPIEKIRLVRNYQLKSKNRKMSDKVAVNDVFSIARIENFDESEDIDLALLRLDRAAAGSQILEVMSDRLPTISDPVYALGYPSGLPLKLTINAAVFAIPDDLNFITTLDTYQGNSGSPIFNYNSHKVIGVLISGLTDYVSKGNCYVSNVCADRTCVNERALNLGKLWNRLNLKQYVEDEIQ